MQSLRDNLKWYILAMLFLANILIWNVLITEARGNVLTVAFLDVGQGDAIFPPEADLIPEADQPG